MHSESDIHPHVPGERAELFLSDDGNSPELEYRDLIAALILAKKPCAVLETGTGSGRTTLAIASTLRCLNQTTCFTTIESNPALRGKALSLLQTRNVSGYVDFVSDDSLNFLVRCTQAQRNRHLFDFCFLDSALSIRACEIELLCRYNLLMPGALIVVHDTSTLREMPAGTRCPESVAYHAELENVLARFPQLVGPIVFPLSRGLHLFQWKGY